MRCFRLHALWLLLLVGSNVWGPTPLARSNSALALHMQNVNGFSIGNNVFNDTVSFYGGETNEDRGFSFVGPTTAYAFMQAMGLVNDHVEGCAVRERAEHARARFRRPR